MYGKHGCTCIVVVDCRRYWVYRMLLIVYPVTLTSSNNRTRSSLSNLHPSPLSSSNIRFAAPSIPPGIPSVSKFSTIHIC